MNARNAVFDSSPLINSSTLLKPGRGIGGHQRAFVGKTDEWLTPPDIIEKLTRHHGPFDLDPCSPINRPWDTAKKHFTIEDNGLSQKWMGSAWLNPPYGPQTALWLQKMANHNDGVVLIFARTETDMFFKYIWNVATSILFIKGRLYFHRVDGTRGKSNSGGPSVLVAYGEKNDERIRMSSIAGKYLRIDGDKE